MGVVGCFVSMRSFRRGKTVFYARIKYSFLWPQRKIRAAEQGNRVRIPDGNRRCMRDVRCSSTKVRHWGRALRTQSRPAKAGIPCPKRKSEDLQKETGQVWDAALGIRCAEKRLWISGSAAVFSGRDRNGGRNQQKSAAGAEKSGVRHDRGRPQAHRRGAGERGRSVLTGHRARRATLRIFF